jgi:hypothetical protein
MRRLAALALIALASTGCIGSSGITSATTTSHNRAAGRGPSTRLLISYPVKRCPAGAHCAVLPVGTGLPQAMRELTCSPVIGDYSDPAAACRALADIVHKERQRQSDPGPIVVCRCLTSRYGPKAVGVYGDKRRMISLDACSLCNLPGVGADLKILLPGAAP